MNRMIETLIALLRERFDDPWCISFKGDWSSQDQTFGLTLKVVAKPETCAVLEYIGTGPHFEDALEDLRMRVVNDTPKENQGLG